jgi:hypothetical protein
VNERLAAARPWFEFYGAKSAEELAIRKGQGSRVKVKGDSSFVRRS